MRRASAFVAFAIVSSFLAAASLPDLFQKGKREFRMGSYEVALATLDQIERESGEPANAPLRTVLAPGLLFYRAACHAALGRGAESDAEFQDFLRFEPSIVLDPALYPNSVRRSLERARSSAARGIPSRRGGMSMADAYRQFESPAPRREEDSDGDWATGPVRFLLRDAERGDYGRLSDSRSRAGYIARFWDRVEPDPGAALNAARAEFDRRVAFADAHFAHDEGRGSLTDRGMVFILMGPPTRVGKRLLSPGEDRSDPAGAARSLPAAALQPAWASSVPDTSRGTTETWHYQRELLPSAVPYQQVDFEFITRQGYGRNVLQRESAPLAALEAGRRSLLQPGGEERTRNAFAGR